MKEDTISAISKYEQAKERSNTTAISITWSKTEERKVVDIPPHDVIAQKYLSFLDLENVTASQFFADFYGISNM